LFGLSLVVAGVVVCANAGRLRERAQGIRAMGTKPFSAGLAMAVCSGICAAAMNVGIGFGEPIVRFATLRGGSADGVVYAVWFPLLLAGAMPNLAYCAYLLQRNRTAGNFAKQYGFRPFPLALLMAVLWFFSTALYGIATRRLGHLGVVIAWPVFMSLIVITAGILGIATGEWRSSGRRPVALQLMGMALLVAAVIAFALAQSQQAPPTNQNARMAPEWMRSQSGGCSDVR
jgi:L-rhamnose-H+ transport protein